MELSCSNFRSTVTDLDLVLRELTTLLTLVKLLVLGTAQLIVPGHKIYGSVNMLMNGTWMT